MNKLVKFFPVFAMVLAVTFAFAFAPAKRVPTRKQAFISSTWQDIPLTHQQNTNYTCSGETSNCTRLLDEDHNVIAGSVMIGTYAPVAP